MSVMNSTLRRRLAETGPQVALLTLLFLRPNEKTATRFKQVRSVHKKA